MIDPPKKTKAIGYAEVGSRPAIWSRFKTKP